MAHPPLLLDLGNRRLKLAVLARDGRPGASERWELPLAEEGWTTVAAELAAAAAGREVRLAVVNPRAWVRLRPALAAAAARLRVAGEDGWPLPVASRGTGADRVMAAWAAWRRCRRGLVVADLGTAWTLDVVDAGGTFRGGAIGAGLGLQVAALARACPHLPAPAPGPVAPGGSIPAESGTAVAAGTAGALAAALRGLHHEFARVLGEADLAAFLTGGDAELLAPQLGPDWVVAPELVLEGLAAWTPGSA